MSVGKGHKFFFLLAKLLSYIEVDKNEYKNFNPYTIMILYKKSRSFSCSINIRSLLMYFGELLIIFFVYLFALLQFSKNWYITTFSCAILIIADCVKCHIIDSLFHRFLDLFFIFICDFFEFWSAGLVAFVPLLCRWFTGYFTFICEQIKRA